MVNPPEMTMLWVRSYLEEGDALKIVVLVVSVLNPLMTEKVALAALTGELSLKFDIPEWYTWLFNIGMTCLSCSPLFRK